MAVWELHVHPERNAVGTVQLGVNAKEHSEIALGMIARIGTDAEPFTGW